MASKVGAASCHTTLVPLATAVKGERQTSWVHQRSIAPAIEGSVVVLLSDCEIRAWAGGHTRHILLLAAMADDDIKPAFKLDIERNTIPVDCQIAPARSGKYMLRGKHRACRLASRAC